MAARITPRRHRRIFLAEWREAKNLTQKQVAEKLGVDTQTISKYERYARGELVKNKPDADVLAAFAEVYGIDPSDLYRHPGVPSVDARLRGQSEEIYRRAHQLIDVILPPKQ